MITMLDKYLRTGDFSSRSNYLSKEVPAYETEDVRVRASYVNMPVYEMDILCLDCDSEHEMQDKSRFWYCKECGSKVDK